MSLRLKRPLLDYQERYVDWAFPQKSPFCGMQLRLGKTLSTIRLVDKWMKSETPPFYRACLVLASKTVVWSWVDELNAEHEKFEIIAGVTKAKRMEACVRAFDSPVRTWVLMNYEGLRLTPELTTLPWHTCVVDDGSVLKNPSSQISIVCCGGRQKERYKGPNGEPRYRLVKEHYGFFETRHKTVLNGMPVTESLLDLFQQYRFLHGSFLGCSNYYTFRNKFFEVERWTRHWKPIKGATTLINKEAHRLGFMLLRSEVNVGGKKFYQARRMEMEPSQRKLYNQVEKEFAIELQRDGVKALLETDNALSKSIWMSRICGGSDPGGNFCWHTKTQELLNLLMGELKDDSVVIWFRFNSEILAIKAALDANAITNTYLNGTVPFSERQTRLQSFRSKKCRVLLCQIKLIKAGIDLSTASTAIYYSLSYSADEIGQSEDRIISPMSKEPRLLMYLVAKDSIDEVVYEAVRTKLNDSKMFMLYVTKGMLERIEQK